MLPYYLDPHRGQKPHHEDFHVLKNRGLCHFSDFFRKFLIDDRHFFCTVYLNSKTSPSGLKFFFKSLLLIENFDFN